MRRQKQAGGRVDMEVEARRRETGGEARAYHNHP
jgi:hypothetical protein